MWLLMSPIYKGTNSYTFTLKTHFFKFVSLFGHFVIVKEIIEVVELESVQLIQLWKIQ